MKTNYIHDCISITRNNGHVIESRTATRQVEELEKVNSDLLSAANDLINKCNIMPNSKCEENENPLGNLCLAIKKATK